MITRFLSSKFSGYIALIGVAVILGLVWYIYNEGKKSCEGSENKAQVETGIESDRQTDAVKKEEQSLGVSDLDRALCGLGIVRGNVGCD